MNEDTLLVRSRQRWKTWMWPAVTWLGLSIVFIAVRQPDPSADGPGWLLLLLLLGLTVAVGGLVWAFLSIRCPSCGARLLWQAARERGPLDCFFWILRVERCPACGSTGGSGV
jgi:hypothetical protein